MDLQGPFFDAERDATTFGNPPLRIRAKNAKNRNFLSFWAERGRRRSSARDFFLPLDSPSHFTP